MYRFFRDEVTNISTAYDNVSNAVSALRKAIYDSKTRLSTIIDDGQAIANMPKQFETDLNRLLENIKTDEKALSALEHTLSKHQG